ncbi:hypothetical protein KFL_007340090 [Klebsormidium nitens]|uniref:Uncharacterized protein n=1 Tax=Klebsormidium nitens TaxID=105231 RepID=A0A1Y1INT5_KLENI|nr:hypothetical protein KFL_007340090 [Klebsormidium nitens]|eukprot:GAQ91149.1 hypothetical protein KFL_007340090 [Klebsormidium nitens]
MDGSSDLADYHCLRERVANLKFEQRKVSKADETALSKQDWPQVNQLNLLHQQEVKSWEGKLHDAMRRLAAQRAEVDKEKLAAAARVNSLVGKLERLEKSSKEAATQMALVHQREVDELAARQRAEREAWQRQQEEREQEHRKELEDKLALVKAKSLAACKEVLQAEAEWKQRHAAQLQETIKRQARLEELQASVEQLTRTAEEARQGESHWKVEYEAAAVKHRRQTAGLQQQLQDSRAALTTAAAAHQADLDQLRITHQAEIDQYRKQKSQDLEDLEDRVRETVSRKDATITTLQTDLAATTRQLKSMEHLLNQLRDESTT